MPEVRSRLPYAVSESIFARQDRHWTLGQRKHTVPIQAGDVSRVRRLRLWTSVRARPLPPGCERLVASPASAFTRQ